MGGDAESELHRIARAARATPPLPGERARPGTLATVAFSLVGVFLLVITVPPLRDSVLLLGALLACFLGVALLAFARGPPGGRWAAVVVLAYLLVLAGLFAASSSVTFGESRTVVNAEPPPGAGAALELALDAMPVALIGGVAAALWAWSGRNGRGLVIGAAAMLVAFLVLAWTGRPDEATAAAASQAALIGRASSLALSLAGLALLAGVALVVGRGRIPWDLE